MKLDILQRLRSTGNPAAALFNAYKTRVLADGGTVENDNCAISYLDSIIGTAYDNAKLIMYPSGYKEGKIYTLKPVPMLGPELVVNGDFGTDSDWSKGAGWTISGGVANGNTAGNWQSIDQNNILTIGATYQITYTIVSRSTGNLAFLCGSAGNGTGVSTIGTHTFTRTCEGNKNLRLLGVYSFVGTVDNVSIKEILVAPADLTVARSSTKSYIDANGIIEEAAINLMPVSYEGGGCGKFNFEPQRTNKVVWSENFDNWGKYGSPVITPNQPFPFASGDSTLVELASGADFIRLLNVDVSSGTHTMHLWAKNDTGSQFYINADSNVGGFNFDTGTFNSGAGSPTGTMVALTDGWFKCTMTFVGNGSGVQIRVQGCNAYFFGAQIEEGTVATSLINTNGSAVTRNADDGTVAPPAGTTQITETFKDGSTNVITSIPATYTVSEGEIQSVVMI
jgi:hypothetical protein